MSFSDLLREYKSQFPQHGACVLHLGEELRACLRDAAVPDEPGVYVIEALHGDAAEIWYVGKAGTMETDGTFKDQGLRQRLANRQGKSSRTDVFPQWIEKEKLSGLRISWFVTRTVAGRVVLPSKAEADLLQSYYDEHDQLPLKNQAA